MSGSVRDQAKTIAVPLGKLEFTVAVAGPESGPPVLLLHGFPETARMWDRQLQGLGAAGYRAFAPNQRGYSEGARPEDQGQYATGLLVADALDLMERLGASRFHLVGHDWGGQLAWLIAAGHSDRLASLSVLSRPHPAAFASAMKEDRAQAERSRHHRSFREADAVARMRSANLKPLRDALLAQGVPADRAELYLRTLAEPGALEGAMNWYRAGAIAAGSVPSVGVPTLYVWGDRDATVGRHAAERTGEHVHGPFRFKVLEGAGHFLVDQFPNRVTALLLEHIRSNPM
ncbi:MAG: alpha/beta hydrolase [Alphaproteobacteria bacterium]|nr:alpha/beta hydrolase [Alphaproteobacteria bacterium]